MTSASNPENQLEQKPDEAAAELEVTVYSPESPISKPFKLLKEIFSDIWKHRELTWILFQRDLKAQFRQSLLGYLWLVLPPIASAFVWYMINKQKIINVDTGEMPYAAYALVGTTLWASFSATVMAPMQAMDVNKDVFMKLNVPMEAFILASTGRVLFNLLLTTVVIFPLLFLLGLNLSLSAILFPLYACCLLVIAFAAGLAIVPISMLYTDIKSVLPPLLSMVMLLSPVIYTVPENEGGLKRFVEVNPLSPSLAMSRDCLIGGDAGLGLYALIWGVVALILVVLSLILLRVSKPHMIARLGM